MNLKKAFVFVLLAFLLINAVSATEYSAARDDTSIIAQQSLDESVLSNGLDSEKDIMELSDNKTDMTNPINTETDITNSIDSETEDIGEGSDSHNDINISFDEQMYEKDLGEINVDLGDDVSGEFCILIDEEVIYNETITDSHFKVPVVLPKKSYELIVNIWPGIDCRRYKVNAFLNGEDLNINKTLQVMKLPPDYSYLHFQDEVLQSRTRAFHAVLHPHIDAAYMQDACDKKRKRSVGFYQTTAATLPISLSVKTISNELGENRAITFRTTYRRFRPTSNTYLTTLFA